MKYMVPLCVVYIAEYFINQGLVCIYITCTCTVAKLSWPKFCRHSQAMVMSTLVYEKNILERCKTANNKQTICH